MNEEKKFVVKEVYAILPGEGQLGEGMFYKHLWKLPIPSKVKGLISRGTHNHLQTMGNLKKGKIIDDVVHIGGYRGGFAAAWATQVLK